MYAIIRSGGKQYRVEKDAIIDVELLDGKPGASIEFKEILFVNDGSKSFFGEPIVKDFLVKGEVMGDAAGPKIVSLKYKRRKNQHTKWGHRQHYSRIKILEVSTAGKAKPPKKVEEQKEEVA